MSTEEKIAGYLAQHLVAAETLFYHWLQGACDSPIEQLLLACMLAEGWGPNEDTASNWHDIHKQACQAGFEPGPWILGFDRVACFCVMQMPVKFGPTTYRVDFAFIECNARDKPRLYAVELDGHDFHERTKEQASKDKKRDRAFAANGWTVLRFSGSDVYRDPAAVLAEVVALMNKQCWPWMEPE